MTVNEQAIVVTQGQDALVGILSSPAMAAPTGVVVVVGGPQYRAGSHRQFVLLARALAAHGYAVLRFDYRGMGDSTGALRDFSDVSDDIGSAIDALQHHQPAVQQVVLWGLCDGASAALLYCHGTHDSRVGGLCLLNPWVRSVASLARAHVKHYYLQRVRQKEFWLKLLTGRMASAALTGLWQNLRTMLTESSPVASRDSTLPFQDRMALGWSGFRGGILLVLSGQDYTAKEFIEYASMDSAWSGLVNQERVVRCDLPDADHTFSQLKNRTEVESVTLQWLQERFPHLDSKPVSP